MKYSYNLYKELVVDKLNKTIEGMEITPFNNRKNNGVVKEGLSLRKKGNTTSPVIYFDDSKEIYDDDDVDKFVACALGVYKKEKYRKDVDVSVLEDWDLVRENIRVKLLNYNMNAEFLDETVPHLKIMDLAVVFVLATEKLLPELDAGNATIGSYFKNLWGVNESTLFEVAMENMSRDGYEFTEIESFISGCFDLNDSERARARTLNLLSCYGGVFGSAVMLNKNILDEVCTHLNGSIHILPASLGEVLVLRAGAVPVETLKKMVCDVNMNIVKDEEILSNNVYYYDKETKELKIADIEAVKSVDVA